MSSPARPSAGFAPALPLSLPSTGIPGVSSHGQLAPVLDVIDLHLLGESLQKEKAMARRLEFVGGLRFVTLPALLRTPRAHLDVPCIRTQTAFKFGPAYKTQEMLLFCVISIWWLRSQNTAFVSVATEMRLFVGESRGALGSAGLLAWNSCDPGSPSKGPARLETAWIPGVCCNAHCTPKLGSAWKPGKKKS